MRQPAQPGVRSVIQGIDSLLIKSGPGRLQALFGHFTGILPQARGATPSLFQAQRSRSKAVAPTTGGVQLPGGGGSLPRHETTESFEGLHGNARPIPAITPGGAGSAGHHLERLGFRPTDSRCRPTASRLKGRRSPCRPDRKKSLKTVPTRNSPILDDTRLHELIAMSLRALPEPGLPGRVRL